MLELTEAESFLRAVLEAFRLGVQLLKDLLQLVMGSELLSRFPSSSIEIFAILILISAVYVTTVASRHVIRYVLLFGWGLWVLLLTASVFGV